MTIPIIIQKLVESRVADLITAEAFRATAVRLRARARRARPQNSGTMQHVPGSDSSFRSTLLSFLHGGAMSAFRLVFRLERKGHQSALANEAYIMQEAGFLSCPAPQTL